jgi:hypothetical protein
MPNKFNKKWNRQESQIATQRPAQSQLELRLMIALSSSSSRKY